MTTLKYYLRLIGTVAVLVLLICTVAFFWFGEFNTFVAYFKGESFVISPAFCDLGVNEAGKERDAVFELTNFTSEPISIIGETSGCNCVFTESLPITAKPHKTVKIKIKSQLPRYTANYDQTITLMVADSDRLVMSPVRIIATINNPLPPPASPSTPPTLAPPPPQIETTANNHTPNTKNFQPITVIKIPTDQK
ncbi:MAG: DUF1573 domain-containing protein [Planctomycetaceae bacterium]|jgi:hypothetical protein|nr:DUF1573 domain-containing protein [Planctomycetaceae bacterium]